MEYFPKVLCGWSWEENKLFELALAVVDEKHPDRWKAVAAMVGGEKSAEDMQNHYVILLEDLQFIESGKLDKELAQEDPSVCWTDEDNKLLVRLDINRSRSQCLVPVAARILVLYEYRGISTRTVVVLMCQF